VKEAMGVVRKVVTRAMTTNMVKTLWLNIPADNPTFKAISSTNPLQLIKTPTVKDSLQSSLFKRAARVPAMILEDRATQMIAIV